MPSSSPRSRRLAPRRKRKRARTAPFGVIALFALSIYSLIFTIKLHKEPGNNSPRPPEVNLPPNAYKFLYSSSPLPSWAVVTECSLMHTDCPNHLKFEDYPFPLEGSTELSTANKFDWIEDTAAPTKSNNDININHLVGYEFPPKADEQSKQECLAYTRTRSIDNQLDHILSHHLTPLKDTYNMIAFTMADEAYSKDMLHDVYEMNNDIVGFQNAFFIVAMDTFTSNMACEYGYPVVAMMVNDDDKNNDADDLKAMVQSTKVYISKLLVQKGQPFLFYEMDVWFLRSPIQLLHQHMKTEYDFLCSTHQWNPGELNIGFYASMANAGTINYFNDSLNIIKENPLAHDQKIMHAVADDNTATLENRTVEDHNNCGWCGHESISFPGVKPTHPIRVGRLDPHVVVSSMYPVPTEGTVALHTLADMPLKGPFGKQMVAKELGVWYGFGKTTSRAGYYHREDEYRRYLLLENSGTRGGQSFIQREGYHDPSSFHRQIAILATLAKATNRILILPQVLGDYHAQPLWLYLDMESLEKLDIMYRETNFVYNKKSWWSHTNPFRSVTQMSTVESLDEIQLLTTTLAEEGYTTAASVSDRIPRSVLKVDDPLLAFLKVASEHPKAKMSEALFVNLSYFQGGNGTSDAVQKVYDSLSWCEWGIGPSSKHNAVSATRVGSTNHCYGKGEAA